MNQKSRYCCMTEFYRGWVNTAVNVPEGWLITDKENTVHYRGVCTTVNVSPTS